MKASEYANMSDKDIQDKISEEKAALAQMKFNHGIAGTENPMNIRKKRREIARMYTVLTEKNNNSK